jgi:hypothetical protein
MEKKYTKSTLELASALILNEQYSMYGYGGGANPASTHMTTKDIKKVVSKDSVSKLWDTYKHDIMFAGSIAALLIPIPGVNIVLSGIISGADAAMYWAEGDRYSALTMAAFALLPGLGKLVQRIPGIKQLGAKGMRLLFRKVIQAKKGAKVLFSNIEKTILKLLPQNKKLIQSEIAKKIATSKIAKKVGRGVLRAPIAAGNVAANLGAADVVTKTVINPLYTSSEMDIVDIESQSDDLLQRIKQQALQGK